MVAERVVAALSRMPAWLAPWVSAVVGGLRQALDGIRQCLKQVETLLAWLLRAIGGPWELDQKGRQWGTQVKAAVGGSASELTQLDGNQFWDGPAGQAYAHEIPLERARVAWLAGLAGQLHDVLTALGARLKVCYVAVAAALSLYLANLLVAVVEATSVVFTATAVASTTTATVSLLAALTVIAVTIVVLEQRTASRLGNLVPVGGGPLFAGNGWSGVPAPMRGMSALNGTPQNWQIR